jgi:hypothetical protein
MKNIFAVLIVLTILSSLFYCGKKKPAEKNLSGESFLKLKIRIQNELVDILEQNEDNPSVALKELDLYYKKYASVLKAELNAGNGSGAGTATEYEAKTSAFEKQLIARQRKALSNLLKKDTQFYAKMMELMRKYGLSN